MTLRHNLFQAEDLALLWRSTVGLEREALRVKPDGTLADSPHSPDWGTRNDQPYIQTDFAESQTEFITPPEQAADDVLRWLAAEHQITATTNEANHEYMWPFSSPALIPQDRNDITIAQLEDERDYNYRVHLADYYGKDVQLLCGIHYNLQLNPRLVDQKLSSYLKQFGLALTEENLIKERNRLYMQLGRDYFRYRWFITYHLGATPHIDPSYATALYGRPHQAPMRSVRQSRYGYQNHEDVFISYESLEQMVHDLEEAVNSQMLSMEKELYRDVRFRGHKTAREMMTKGIKYIEFRNFDINPYAPYGMTTKELDFVRLFILSLLFLPEAITDSDVIRGNQMNRLVAEDHPLASCPYYDEGVLIYDTMAQLAQAIDRAGSTQLEALVQSMRPQLDQVELTRSGRIITDCPELTDYTAFGMKLAQEHQAVFLDKPYTLHGFTDLELSTQDVMKEAIRAGIKVDLIDPLDNLLRLNYHGQVELVRNGNMTGRDSLISYFVMNNKVATKRLLSEAGIAVPHGENFDSIEAARLYYHQLPDHGLVIKPKNTNYGIGITIFQTPPSQSDYDEAIDLAFSEDQSVIVEDFISGTELRFYVQDGQVKAVCERQPAQVKGDGVNTISELIDQANQNPLRGPKHYAPLSLIEKGRAEQLQLHAQGLTLDDVPANDQVVYVRENSNVSTGGLPIDVTDQVHPSYLQLAQKAAEVLDAKFCGVDMIIHDYHQAPSEDNPYGIIEANYNPAMTLHRFPVIGQERPMGRYVLELLFPEVPL